MSPTYTTMRFKLRDDHVVMAAEQSGEIRWSKSFNAEELDDVIQQLGRFRASLQQVVNSEIDPNARVEAVVQPAVVMRDHGAQGFEILLRHPGFGWLSFLLDDPACKVIGKAMLNREDPT